MLSRQALLIQYTPLLFIPLKPAAPLQVHVTKALETLLESDLFSPQPVQRPQLFMLLCNVMLFSMPAKGDAVECDHPPVSQTLPYNLITLFES